jgi:hypothetical protein
MVIANIIALIIGPWFLLMVKNRLDPLQESMFDPSTELIAIHFWGMGTLLCLISGVNSIFHGCLGILLPLALLGLFTSNLMFFYCLLSAAANRFCPRLLY